MNLQNLSIEQLQEIVDGAPEGATHYATNEADFNYYKREPFRSSVWIDDYWQSLFNDFDACSQRYIELSDIRAALVNQRLQSDFAVGDLVVIKSSWKPDNKRLYEIEDIKGTSVRVSAYIPHLHKFSREILGFCIGIENIRTITLAEKAAGYRIDETEEELLAEAEVWRECREPCRFDRLEAEPENGWAINPTRNKVCIEQETPDLFNSKHCSPRNYNNDSQLRVSEIKASAAYSKMALTNFTLSEKNGRLKTNNHALKAALAMSIVVGVVGWML